VVTANQPVVVVYGYRGDMDAPVIRALGAAGAGISLTGRQLEPVDRLARELAAGAGVVTTARVDPYDAAAVEDHLTSVLESAGRIDVCCSFVTVPAEITSVPLATGSSRPTYVPAYFLPARLAVTYMIGRGTGTLLLVGDRDGVTGSMFDPAAAVKRALVRDLREEGERHGVDVAELTTPVTPAALGPVIERLLAGRAPV
jgi:3-oxoacyl-[acyl-carrier protein] reductase